MRWEKILFRALTKSSVDALPWIWRQISEFVSQLLRLVLSSCRGTTQEGCCGVEVKYLELCLIYGNYSVSVPSYPLF